MKTILTEQQIALAVQRLAHQIIENHLRLDDTILIGLQPRGIFVSDKIVKQLQLIAPAADIKYGLLDITFYRDDIRQSLHVPNTTQLNFSIENKKVVLIR